MRSRSNRRSTSRPASAVVLVALAASSALLALALPAHATKTDVTNVTDQTADPYGHTSTFTLPPVLPVLPVPPATSPFGVGCLTSPTSGSLLGCLAGADGQLPRVQMTLRDNQGASAPNATIAANGLRYAVLTGPDAGLDAVSTINGPLISNLARRGLYPVPPIGLESEGSCGEVTGAPVPPYGIVDPSHPVCTFAQGLLSLVLGGGGTDTIVVWVEQDDTKNVFHGGEPFITVNVTYANNPLSSGTNPKGAQSNTPAANADDDVKLNPAPPAKLQADACNALTASAVDGPNQLLGGIFPPGVAPVTDTGGRAVPGFDLAVQIVQKTSNLDPAPTLKFCGLLPSRFYTAGDKTNGVAETVSFPSTASSTVSGLVRTTVLKAIVTTGSRGEPGNFSIQTDSTGPITVSDFWDKDGNGRISATPADSVDDVYNTQTYTVIQGGPDGVSHVGISLPSTTVFSGETVSGIVTLTNVENSPSPGVSPVLSIAGANPQTITLGKTDSKGQTPFSYMAVASGKDTLTAYVNQSAKNSGVASGALDDGEPFSTVEVNITPSPSDVAVTLIAHGSLAGGQVAKDAGISGADAQHAIDPLSNASETFTAIVTDAKSGAPRSGVTVRFLVPTTGGRVSGAGSSANDATLNVGSGLSNSQGVVSATLTNPSPVAGDAFKVVASVGGVIPPANAFVLYESPTTATTADPTKNALGTTFPTTRGIITVKPNLIVTQKATPLNLVATIKDQFGNAASGIKTFFNVVSGRNVGSAGASDTSRADGTATATLNDTSTAAVPTGGDLDTIQVVSDIDGNPNTTGDQSITTALRYYTDGSPNAAAVEGGVGPSTRQFGSTSPFAPVTTDNNGNAPIDVTHAVSAQTPTAVFFAARSADNVPLYGRTINVALTGVGAIVSGDTNTVSDATQDVVIDKTGYAVVHVLSLRTGVQTLTAVIDNVRTVVTVTWTNSGTQRNISLTPVSATTAPAGSIVTVTATAKDVYGNIVAGAPVVFTVTSPGTFIDGSNTVNGSTGSDGTLVARVNASGTGSAIIVTGSTTGPEVSKLADDPVAGATAGNSSSSTKITVASPVAANSSRTTLTFSPSANAAPGSTITAIGTIRDANGATLAGKRVSFTVSGVANSQDPNLTTDSNGKVSFPITSSQEGTGTVTMKVFDNAGTTEVTKTADVIFGSGGTVNSPKLTENSLNGIVTLTFQTDPQYSDHVVYFFRRSGITGKVVPLGTGNVNSNGFAFRTFNSASGGILALYGKVLGAENIKSPYSNDVRFRVN